MTVASSIVNQGTLTTSTATIRTGTATEYHSIVFTNYSGSDVTLEIFINGTADVNRIGKAETLEANGGYAILDGRIGSGNTIRAKASANSSVAWSDELTTL